MKLSLSHLFIAALAIPSTYAYTAWNCDATPTGYRCVVSVVFKLSTSALTNAFSRGSDIAGALSNHVRDIIRQPNLYPPQNYVREKGVAFWTTRQTLNDIFIVVKQYYDFPDGYYAGGQMNTIPDYANNLALAYGFNHILSNFEPTNTNLADTYFYSSTGRKRSAELTRGEAAGEASANWLDQYENWNGTVGAHPSILELEELEKDWLPPASGKTAQDYPDFLPNANSSDLAPRSEGELEKRTVGSCWYMTSYQIRNAERSGWMVPTAYQDGCSSSGQTT